jgi:2-hydroxy-3-oxopropionate reductase
VTASVSVIGLGVMGRPVARSLHAQGFLVRGWNRSPRTPEEVGDIELCATLDDAALSETIMLVLADPAAVDAVLAELGGKLTAGQIVVDLGSSDPQRSRAHAARLGAAGVGWVDAPVSGGPEASRSAGLRSWPAQSRTTWRGWSCCSRRSARLSTSADLEPGTPSRS